MTVLFLSRTTFWSRLFAGCLVASFALISVRANAQNRDHRHSKLDRQLNDAATRDSGAESTVIVQFHDESEAASILTRNGARTGRRLGILQAHVATISHRRLTSLADEPRVKSIHLDRVARSTAGRAAVTVGARAVHDLMGYTGAGIGIAVIDSGITSWHDDLTIANGAGQRRLHFVDFVNGYTQAYDDQGHGTHVAGIIAGNGFDSNGLRSAIAPGSHIVALKALDANGTGTISNIIAAIDYAVANKDALNIRVINLSLGAGVYESYMTDPLTVAARRAVDAGVVVVAAAGNLGNSANGQPQYGAVLAPGNAPWVVTVGASSTMGTVFRQDDTIAGFSSRGPTMHDYQAKPDLVAPGTGTVSLSDPLSRFYVSKSEYLLAGTRNTSYLPYLSMSGTSMSAPVVSGSIALMLQANPSLSPNLVKAMLQFTAQQYPGYDALTQGAGFLNTRGAVRLAEFFQNAQPGMTYPSMTGWSKHIIWGNKRVSGGVLTPDGSAWLDGVTWGAPSTPSGADVIWGNDCADASCDNVVWGNDGDDNVVWGNSDEDNVVWGNSSDDNVVWGNDCGGSDCDNVVWGNDGDDNVVWGNSGDDNVVWGNNGDDNVVWGNDDVDNVVWGNAATQAVIFASEFKDICRLPSGMWDALFPLDAQLPNGAVAVTSSGRK
ncbi:MAG TPA: S8 family serine peptidase [Vicinamibacterales bacterium]|nr:S8 family serine peptidase [Vicinamibacterales bacterium]